MKVKCLKCETIYNVELGSCSSCGNRGGFLQEPKMKTIGQATVHLEETWIHTPSNNEYQIKEIQSEGMIAKITSGLLPQVINKLAYISNSTLNEYRRKE